MRVCVCACACACVWGAQDGVCGSGVSGSGVCGSGVCGVVYVGEGGGPRVLGVTRGDVTTCD